MLIPDTWFIVISALIEFIFSLRVGTVAEIIEISESSKSGSSCFSNSDLSWDNMQEDRSRNEMPSGITVMSMSPDFR